MGMYSDDPAVDAILNAWVKRGQAHYRANREAIDRDNREYADIVRRGNRSVAERDRGTPGTPKAAQGPVRASGAKERSRAILEYLKARPHSHYTAADLAAILKCTPSAARRSLTWLKRAGKVESDHRGWVCR